MEEEVECDSTEGGMEGTTEPGQTADQDDSTVLPVPPDGVTPSAEDTTEGDGEPSGAKEAKRRTKLVSRTIDPPPPPKQVEVGRRAQVRRKLSFRDAILSACNTRKWPVALRDTDEACRASHVTPQAIIFLWNLSFKLKTKPSCRRPC